MALAQMLSALKSLILEIDEIPSDQEDRQVLYAELFKTLSDNELEDLARIPPEQIQSYTRFAVSADRSALQGHMPLTFALLKREWPRLRDEEFHSAEMVKSVLRRYPWKGYYTLDLAKNFAQFLRDELPLDSELRCLLLDVAEIECYCLQIKRHLLGVPPTSERREISELRQLTIPDFLNTKAKKNPQLGFLHSSFDIVALLRKFSELGKKSVPDSYPMGPGWFIVARDPENLTGPNAVSQCVYNFLLGCESEFSLEELALASVSQESAGSKTDIEQFQVFMSTCLELIDSGIIYLPQISCI